MQAHVKLRNVSFPLLINFLIGFVLLYYAGSVFTGGRHGEALVDRLRKQGQSAFGEYWNVHEYIVGVVLLLAGIFFLAMAFSIFASHHDWWVLKWF